MSLPLLATWIQGSPPRLRGALATLRDTGPSSKSSVSTGCLLLRLRPPSLFIGLCCKPHTLTPLFFFFFFFFLNKKPCPSTTFSSLESSGSALLRSPLGPKLLACRFPAFRAQTAFHIRHAVRPFTLAQYGRSQTPRPVSPSVISAQSNPDPLSGSRLGLPPHRNSAKAEACPLSTRPASTVSLTLVGSALFLQSWGFSASSEGEGTLRVVPVPAHDSPHCSLLENDLPISKGGIIMVPNALLLSKTNPAVLYWLPSQVNFWDCPLRILPHCSYSVESFCCRNQYSRNQALHSESWRTQVYFASGPRGVNTPNSEP